MARDGTPVFSHHVAELNALVMDFALPASLFVATASTPRVLLLAQWPLLVVFIVSMPTEQFRAVLREASPRLPRAGYRLLRSRR